MPKRTFKKSTVGLAFIDDLVLKAVEIDPRVTEGQMFAFSKFLLWQTKLLIKEPQRHSIRFPHLGVFHMRIGFAKAKVEDYKKWAKKNPEATRRFRERLNLLKQQVENFEEKFQRFREKAPQDKRIISVHLKPRFLNMPAYRRGASIEEVERRIIKMEHERRKFDF
jgi:hypothetical protein